MKMTTRKGRILNAILILIFSHFLATRIWALSPSSELNARNNRTSLGIERLYQGVDFQYYRAIRTELFEGIESPAVLVPASGSDISAILLLTDATYAVLIDLLPFGSQSAGIEQGKIEEYFEAKKIDTYTEGDFLRDEVGNLRTFVEEELIRIGATDYRVVQDLEFKNVYHLHFKWSYPGEEAKERLFTFVGETNARDIAKWTKWVPETKFNVFILKAGEYQSRLLVDFPPDKRLESLPRFIEEVLPYMGFDSYVITDTTNVSLSGTSKRLDDWFVELVSVTNANLREIEKMGPRFGYNDTISWFDSIEYKQPTDVYKAADIYQVKVRPKSQTEQRQQENIEMAERYLTAIKGIEVGQARPLDKLLQELQGEPNAAEIVPHLIAGLEKETTTIYEETLALLRSLEIFIARIRGDKTPERSSILTSL